jgi:hypothetical protein
MNELAVLVGLISFPGLIATILCDKLLVHAERWNAFKYAIYTFVFGVSSYVLLQAIVWIIGSINRHLPFLHDQMSLRLWDTLVSGRSLSFTEVAWATALSPAIALLATICVNKKLVHRIAQRFGISNKYGDENLFSYFLNSPDIYWIYLRDRTSGQSYRGLVRSFSETKELQEVVLTNVTVYNYEDSDELYALDSIYISKPLGSFVIEAPPSHGQGKPNDGKEKNSAQRGYGARPSEGRRDSRDKQAAAPSTTAPTSACEEVK